MKKFISTAAGGAPINSEDLKDVFNSEIWDAMQALMSQFNSDTEGVIVSGCAITGGGPYNIATGIVYLDGEFRRLPAQTGVTLPKYIAAKATVNDSRTFANLTTNPVVATKDAELVSIAPVTQYVAITTTTDPDNRRLSNISVNKQLAIAFQSTVEALGGFRTEGSGSYLKTKIVDIGDWNMDVDDKVRVLHGVSDYKKIRGVTGVIRNDADTEYYTIPTTADLFFANNEAFTRGSIETARIGIGRLASSDFDNTNFDSTSYNRGWLMITYEA